MLVALMMVGVGRLWFCAGRGRMHDDPIVFALTDVPSLVIGALAAIIVIGATL